jgi:hypothetical protein
MWQKHDEIQYHQFFLWLKTPIFLAKPPKTGPFPLDGNFCCVLAAIEPFSEAARLPRALCG